MINIIKKYINNIQEKRRIKRQYLCEKTNIDYFNNYILHINDINELKSSIKDTPLLIKSDSSSYPIQAVKACIEDDKIKLYYGDYNYQHKIEWAIRIKDFPSKLWFSVEKFHRPTCPALLLCDYGTGHYEVVEYENKTWTTEFCFPIKPVRYFVLKFLNDETR